MRSTNITRIACFGYRCFDRILLNGLIQPFQQPERVVGFFSTYRHLHPVNSRSWISGEALTAFCDRRIAGRAVLRTVLAEPV